MAKVSPLLAILSGSVGGNTWARNKGGLYLKMKASPVNPNSGRQQAVRGFLSTASGDWSGLDVAQRIAWAVWADEHPLEDPLGQSYTLTGHQAYVWHATRVLDQGLVALGDPPAGPVPNALTSIGVAFTSDTAIDVTFLPTPLAADEALFAWQGPPQGLTGDPNRAQSRLIGYTAQAATSPQSLTLPMTVSSGFTSNFWVGIINAEGQVGPALKDSQLRA